METDKRTAVLVIDDERGLREMLVYMLGRRGFLVVAASDGEEGLKLAKEQPFDAVVCDIMMPGMDGQAVLKAIKESHPGVEVIMSTGFASLESAVACMKLGAYDYVAKPYEIDQLCQILAKAVERKRLKESLGDLERGLRELAVPTNAIVGDVARLLERLGKSQGGEQEQALLRVQASAKRMLELVNGLVREPGKPEESLGGRS